MKRLILLAAVSGFLVSASAAFGQQMDLAFGVGTVTAPSASSASGKYSPQSLSGGAYPAFSGDVLFFKKQFGINGEVAWRASEAKYYPFQNPFIGPQPYRPIFFDFNGIWVPQVSKRAAPELMAGIGGEDVRFYQQFFSCSYFGCTNYTATTHFMGHFSGGLRLYVFGNFFVRPEAHLYLIHNNFEFSSGRATRFGVSIGYSLRPGF
jgi:hypothetical protein